MCVWARRSPAGTRRHHVCWSFAFRYASVFFFLLIRSLTSVSPFETCPCLGYRTVSRSPQGSTPIQRCPFLPHHPSCSDWYRPLPSNALGRSRPQIRVDQTVDANVILICFQSILPMFHLSLSPFVIETSWHSGCSMSNVEVHSSHVCSKQLLPTPLKRHLDLQEKYHHPHLSSSPTARHDPGRSHHSRREISHWWPYFRPYRDHQTSKPLTSRPSSST